MIDVIIIGAGGSGLGIHGRLLTAPSRSVGDRWLELNYFRVQNSK